jgi:lipopolysaccharide export system permease protein
MLSRTLFNYIFKDLFRIFMMTSGALAGIMSFGGLLRPLTREGLDAGQVGRMLTYFTPAMTTYSFPIAALFATAVVYGRLSADNELTAARSSGISLISLTVAGPALVLGLIVAIVSLLFLCFIVPASTYKVEQVVYSNLAKLIAGRIERNHEIRFNDTTIFAQDALMPAPQTLPFRQQQVVLVSPTIVKVERPRPDERDYRVPKDFFTASRAILYIDPLPSGEEVQITMRLEGGFKFPRSYIGAVEAGIAETEYGPIVMNSPIKEDVKFMDVWRLKDLYKDISGSQNIRRILGDFILNAQRQAYFMEVATPLNSPRHEVRFNFEGDSHYLLRWQGRGPSGQLGAALVAPLPQFASPKPPTTGAAQASSEVVRDVIFQQQQGGQTTFSIRAARMQLFARPMNESGQVNVTVKLEDCHDGTTARPDYIQSFTVPMSQAVKSFASRGLDYYESPAARAFGDQQNLTREKISLFNAIIAESNGRASFAISCLILVMAGCALGMMFKSGNFLTAFAVSFIPALLSITLIIAGQRTAAHLPIHFNPANNSPLQAGLVLVWIGNAVNLVLAATLLWRLGRK